MPETVANRMLASVGLSALLLLGAGCSSQPTESSPQSSPQQSSQSSKGRQSTNKTATSKVQPQKIRIEAPNQPRLSPTAKPLILEKDLFNIEASTLVLKVNATPIKDLKALEKILAAYQKPVITLAAHICMSADQTTEILTMAQRHTDSPIAFGSWGDYDDPECDQ